MMPHRSLSQEVGYVAGKIEVGNHHQFCRFDGKFPGGRLPSQRPSSTLSGKGSGTGRESPLTEIIYPCGSKCLPGLRGLFVS